MDIIPLHTSPISSALCHCARWQGQEMGLHRMTTLGSAQALGKHEKREQTGLAMPALVQGNMLQVQ